MILGGDFLIGNYNFVVIRKELAVASESNKRHSVIVVAGFVPALSTLDRLIWRG